MEASYTGSRQPPAGVWDGEVPAPVAPGHHDPAPPGAPGDAVAAEPDEVAEKPAG